MRCAVLVSLVFAGASAPAAEPRPTGVAPPTRIPEVLQDASPPGEPVAIVRVPRETRRAVVADAARRFNVKENQVVLARAERVTWPDGSLGCPEPGQMYTQVPVPGFRLVAKTPEGELLYHADSRGNVRHCGGFLQAPHEELRRRKAPGPVTGPPATPDR